MNEIPQRCCGYFCLLVCTVFVLGSALESKEVLGQQSAQPQKPASQKEDSKLAWPGKKTEGPNFSRYDFNFDGRAAYVIVPKHPAPGNPWIWRARFPGFHDGADKIMIGRGFHIARINTDGMLGSPRAMEHWNKFYDFLVKRGLAQKCALEGVSRGGLFVYGFANRWPERVSSIYCDTPVCDIKSWPGGKGNGRGHPATWKVCLNEYGLNEETVKTFTGIPIDSLERIAEAKIPVLHVVSLNDVIVPPDENTFALARRYRELGGSIDIIEVKEGTEKSGGHHFEHPDPLRVADFIEQHSTTRVGSQKSEEHFILRGKLDNCRIKFQKTGKGRVVFMGGSITTMNGWRKLVCDYLTEKFPKTEFDFIDAGISSTGSVPGSFRLMRDVFAYGPVDLLFEEAAVNDLHNMRSPVEMKRGMEGILRHARKVNPNIDIVMMHFVDPKHIADYRQGNVPKVVQVHEQVAEYYNVPTIHLAKEVTDRIEAGQFTWKDDFKNCHPSPFGHRLYESTIRRTLNAAWSETLQDGAEPKAHPIPDTPLDGFSFDGGKMLPLESAKLNGFSLIENCDPRANSVGGNVRPGYHNVPMLVGDKPDDEFAVGFKGRAFGIFVASGPDAGKIAWSIDGGPWKTKDLFTKWSKQLHIPWVYVLESELKPGEHQVRVRVVGEKNGEKNGASKGSVCRIVNLLVNE